MTKPWKLKMNSSNILLVLITLILIKTERTRCESDGNAGPGTSVVDLRSRSVDHEEIALVGNDQIARYYFRSYGPKKPASVLTGVNRCLENFQIVTCLKLMLLDRINEAVEMLDAPEMADRDLIFMNGLIAFNRKPSGTVNANRRTADEEASSLDEEISSRMLRLFRNRLLRLNLFSRYGLEIEPVDVRRKNDDFICFRYKINTGTTHEDNRLDQARGRKKGGMNMMMMMPQMIMLGLLPFTLATIKAFVMNAMMVNMMALNGAIFMTIRNFVFGPRSGGNVQYVNYGYSKDRQTQKKRPALIIHSPAAFVKQPVYHHYSDKPYHQHHYHDHHNHHQQYVSRESEYREDEDGSIGSDEIWRESAENDSLQESHLVDGFARRRQSFANTRRMSTAPDTGNLKVYLLGKKVVTRSPYQQKPKRMAGV